MSPAPTSMAGHLAGPGGVRCRQRASRCPPQQATSRARQGSGNSARTRSALKYYASGRSRCEDRIRLSDDHHAGQQSTRAACSPVTLAAVQPAIRVLRGPFLGQDYTAAWEEWPASGGQAACKPTDRRGLADRPGDVFLPEPDPVRGTSRTNHALPSSSATTAPTSRLN